jgi:hypothetical protein
VKGCSWCDPKSAPLPRRLETSPHLRTRLTPIHTHTLCLTPTLLHRLSALRKPLYYHSFYYTVFHMSTAILYELARSIRLTIFRLVFSTLANWPLNVSSHSLQEPATYTNQQIAICSVCFEALVHWVFLDTN